MLGPKKPFIVGRSSNLGSDGPQTTGRSSQAVSDSDAATRQQVQNDDIVSSDSRLVEKIVVRGSWFVARKSLPLYSNEM